jgi:hypothetical protein
LKESVPDVLPDADDEVDVGGAEEVELGEVFVFEMGLERFVEVHGGDDDRRVGVGGDVGEVADVGVARRSKGSGQ